MTTITMEKRKGVIFFLPTRQHPTAATIATIQKNMMTTSNPPSECAYEEEGATLASLVYDDEDEERRFDALSIKMVIEALPDLERKLILLRYFKDFSQIKTAGILGITQVKVSRLEKKILAFMKTKLT